MAKTTHRPQSPSESIDHLNACVSSAGAPRLLQNEATFREWVVQNQIGISLTILSTLLAAHNLYPSVQSFTTPFFQMSYYQPDTGLYSQGWDDVYFVASAILAFTAVRAIFIDWIFRPFAKSTGLKKKTSIRFAEQAWLIVYDVSYWSYGVYLWSNSSYWGDFRAVWAEWPKPSASAGMKWYLLTQLAFWIQQIFVVNIEERRKDFLQMLSHHVATSMLLGSAYIYRFYNVANVVLSLMDIVDWMLPLAKILKYYGYEILCNVVFVLLILTWFVSRHVIYPALCWSIFKNIPVALPYGCYSGKTAVMYTANAYPNRFAYLFGPYLNEEGPICMNQTVKWIFLSFLLFLQGLSMLWFTLIVKIAINAVRSGNAEDSRSDGEDEEGEEEDEETENQSNETARAALADRNSNAESSWRRANGSVRTRRGHGRVLGDSDRKALLGRIGCDKPTHD
ncbi:putative longevity-assurance protein [Talaromyces proteolyticus]|uniref:Longevity-assurance protein n=1 Tax=Talaromyces proteolyticus TaxID=1131652 RepID=A0AAD4KRE6_9EURO|nr:putative longevity-assurance protein [Talaromyces proteolyticus]KAH8697273.1 putative longevity-assurance protein [Talaromyces proteolyticus]